MYDPHTILCGMTFAFAITTGALLGGVQITLTTSAIALGLCYTAAAITLYAGDDGRSGTGGAVCEVGEE